MSGNSGKNDDMIKKALEAAPVPEELSPGNIEKMLDEKAPVKKRKNIKYTALKITAGAAACAVIGGFGVHYAEQGNLFNKENKKSLVGASYSSVQETGGSKDKESSRQLISDGGIESYEQLYQLLGEASESYNETIASGWGGMIYEETAMEDGAVEEEAVDSEAPMENENESAQGMLTDDSTAINGGMGDGGGGGEGDSDYYNTYNQEQGVLEADIVKTDGEHIYYLYTEYDWDTGNDHSYINIAAADNGSFTEAVKLDISDDFPVPDGDYDEKYTYLQDMYLYNDMLIVIAGMDMYISHEKITVSMEDCIGYSRNTYSAATCVNVYTTGTEPQLIGSYMQDGSYNDVRIAPDGYMYLITNDFSESYEVIDGAEDVESYVPTYTFGEETCLVAPEDIIVPECGLEENPSINYTIVGSLDFNTSGAFTETDILSFAGFSGELYCSGSNIYIADGWDETVINRISLENGIIAPAASGTVKGYIKDQFSMSEYNGYFRVATTENLGEETIEEYEGETFVSYRDLGETNHVFVLDMDMNIVGSISDFGVDETIKSVNFSGDTAYVVTYEQTDPLFSIDLSDPTAPVILDEFKILGYSTYMQQWSDGLLLGFGASADENGVEDGVKLVMFDNSDPYDLREVGIEMMTSDPLEDDYWIYSDALWERKMLLIAPEKNIIGVPYMYSSYDEENGGVYTIESRYEFFSYEDGDFVGKGSIAKDITNSERASSFERAVYIGDYVYIISGDSFIAADIDTITVSDSVAF
ncbi:MAG: beta-propeller domain-containing protein [Ruminococcus sp.]|nr:beta-propeller domain-containing protein [Ruminococcus sp.]